MFTLEKFMVGLCKSTRCLEANIENEEIIISGKFRDYEDEGQVKTKIVGQFSMGEIENILHDLQNGTTFEADMLYQSNYFEVPIKSEDRFRGPMRFYEETRYEVEEHNFHFFISKASSKYFVALFCHVANNPDMELEFGPFFHGYIRNDNVNSFEELCAYFRIQTVHITSNNECSIGEYKKLTQSYLFNISYNTNLVFSMTKLSEDNRIRTRRTTRRGQLFPYKTYKSELVKYYYQGLTSDIAFTQYLAFYHVAEYFFQSISEEDAFSEIEKTITHPSFAPRKKEDIRNFYNKIKKIMREQREDGVWDEKTGLLLCLKKFIPDIDTLKNSINAIDASAIDYYMNNETVFADEGNKINFSNITEGTYKEIRNRIYAVRNSIVHSKEGEKLRYEPFKHDKELSREIPLIRAVAEEIIVSSAEMININYD